MYYVPDGTEQCGYYECIDCGNRFLDLRIGPAIVCPYCGETPDMEIGPDEEMPTVVEPTEEPIAADDGEFNTPFEFDAPEADGVRKFEKPEVADFFVDFDEPIGEPITEKELYGDGEEPIEDEKIDADVEEED